MQSLKSLLRRLASPRNMLPLVIIIGAVVGVFDISFFGVRVESEQIIMALLGFLAIDALIERLDILANIEQGIRTISRTISPSATSDAFFRSRDFHKVENLIREANNEIWVYGVTLDGLVTLAYLLEDKLKEGCKVRILAPDPNGSAILETAYYFGSRRDLIAMRLKNNLDILSYRLKRVANCSLEINVLNRVFTTGYVITNPNNIKGTLLIQHYMYWTGIKAAPTFELSNRHDRQWYPVYLSQFAKAWEDSVGYNS